MLVFVLNSPLHDTLVLRACGQHGSVFKNFNRLDLGRVSTEAACGCHICFFDKIKTEIYNLQLFDRQRREPENVKTSVVTTANRDIQQAESLNFRHKSQFSE